MSEEYKNWFGRLHHLHYIYVILILLLILVSIIAYYHSDEHDLVAQVGFAASISSIILSVLAIIVTVVSNGSMDKLAHGMYGLRNVPADVKKSTDDAIKKITDTTNSLNKASEENSQGIADMQKKFEDLFHELEQHVADKLQENANSVENIKKMVTDMQVSTQSLANSMSSDSKIDLDSRLSEELVDHLMERNSLAGYVFLYTINNYIEKNLSVPFNLKKMDEIYQDQTYSQYFYGYLVLMIAMNICEANTPSKERLEYVFTSLDPLVRDKMKENIGKKKLSSAILAKIDSYLDELSLQNNSGDGEQK